MEQWKILDGKTFLQDNTIQEQIAIIIAVEFAMNHRAEFELLGYAWPKILDNMNK